MPNIKSAVKRVRTSAENRVKNIATRSTIQTVGKQFQAAVASGDKAQAMAMFSKFAATVDNAAKRGIIKANTASRSKARASKQLAAR